MKQYKLGNLEIVLNYKNDESIINIKSSHYKNINYNSIKLTINQFENLMKYGNKFLKDLEEIQEKNQEVIELKEE